MITQRDFDGVYQRAVEHVHGHWTPAMQAKLAAHCKPWATFDFRTYLECSCKRYYLAYQRMAAAGAKTVCDVGGFWGAFPIALTELGFRVTMTEALQYYDDAFEPLFASIRAVGVTVLDCDPFAGACGKEQFDFVTALAILEHYPHSLKTFMENFRGMIAPGGRGYVEVPSIAYWPKRVGLLRGRSPLPSITDIYDSESPFTGHHHEFTMAELEQLAELAELQVTHRRYYNYSLTGRWVFRLLRHPIQTVALAIFPATREVLAMEVALPEIQAAPRCAAA